MKFLIVKVGAFGDLSFALPLVHRMQQHFPACEISWLVDQTYEQFLARFEGIHRILPIDSKGIFHGHILQKTLAAITIRKQTARYDGIFLLHRNLAWFVLLQGKGPIFRLARKSFLGRSNDVIVPPQMLHESMAYKSVWDAFAIQNRLEPSTQPWFTPPNILPSKHLNPQIAGLKPNVITFHVGGGENSKTAFNGKKWPHFPELVAKLTQSTDHQVVLIGTNQDAQSLNLPESPQLINLLGKTSWEDLLDLAKISRVFVGPDSGPLHLFDLLGVPCVGLYGPTSERSWGLMGADSRVIFDANISCRPCYRDDGFFPACPIQYQCMKNISTQQVYEQIKNFLPAGSY